MPVARKLVPPYFLPELASARDVSTTSATAATATSHTGPFLSMPAPTRAVIATTAAATPAMNKIRAIRMRKGLASYLTRNTGGEVLRQAQELE